MTASSSTLEHGVLRFKGRRQWVGYGLLTLVALLTRLYHLDQSPLWYDELYSYQVSSQDFLTILRNSLYDAHPPLHFLILKVTSGFGLWQTEWGYRWFSAFCGALTLTAFYYLASRIANRWCTGLAWLMLLFSPTVMYYSQETRSYIVVMLVAALTTSILFNLSRFPSRSVLWWSAWTGLSIIGIYTSYSYLIVLPVQALYLAWLYRLNRPVRNASAVLLLFVLLLLPFLWFNLARSLDRTAGSAPLTFAVAVQTLLAGEWLRYGISWETTTLPFMLGFMALIGIWSALVDRRDKFTWYIAVQVVAPLVIYFGIGEYFLKWHMPAYQTKQFLVLLPAFYLLVVQGMQWCVDHFPARTGYLFALVICGAVIMASTVGLERHWTTSRSPEGLAVQMVRRHLTSEDGVVSLGDALNSAASFYLPPGHRVYTAPQKANDGYVFDDNLLVLGGQVRRDPRFSLDTIRAYTHFWVLSDTRRDPSPRDALVTQCHITDQQMFGPFEVLQVEQCLP